MEYSTAVKKEWDPQVWIWKDVQDVLLGEKSKLQRSSVLLYKQTTQKALRMCVCADMVI